MHPYFYGSDIVFLFAWLTLLLAGPIAGGWFALDTRLAAWVAAHIPPESTERFERWARIALGVQPDVVESPSSHGRPQGHGGRVGALWPLRTRYSPRLPAGSVDWYRRNDGRGACHHTFQQGRSRRVTVSDANSDSQRRRDSDYDCHIRGIGQHVYRKRKPARLSTVLYRLRSLPTAILVCWCISPMVALSPTTPPAPMRAAQYSMILRVNCCSAHAMARPSILHRVAPLFRGLPTHHSQVSRSMSIAHRASYP